MNYVSIGNLHAGDIIWLRDARCGRVQMFYNVHETIVVHVDIYQNMDNPAMFDESVATNVFIDGRQIVDACTWYYENPGIVKVAIPPLFLASLRPSG